MEKTQIQVKSETLESLKILKRSLNISTYDEVIEALVRQSYSGEKSEKISNEELLNVVEKNDRKSLKRIEALHTRIGYFEKDYFLKIDHIYDEVSKRSAQNVSVPSVSSIEEKKNVLFDENSYRQKIEDLEQSHEELENVNEKLFKKINLIKNNISKKTGVFASGYDLGLSEEEFNFFMK